MSLECDLNITESISLLYCSEAQPLRIFPFARNLDEFSFFTFEMVHLFLKVNRRVDRT